MFQHTVVTIRDETRGGCGPLFSAANLASGGGGGCVNFVKVK